VADLIAVIGRGSPDGFCRTLPRTARIALCDAAVRGSHNFFEIASEGVFARLTD
jgi:hypothetical protein